MASLALKGYSRVLSLSIPIHSFFRIFLHLPSPPLLIESKRSVRKITGVLSRTPQGAGPSIVDRAGGQRETDREVVGSISSPSDSSAHRSEERRVGKEG